MSSSIWTRCAAASEPGGSGLLRPLRLSPWRVVESQHQVSTRKLVDTLEEQEVLEELIEAAKPPDSTGGRLHYLLATPFRYPPLRHGSRFGTRHEKGIWYGAEETRTAFAEVAYYRFVFLEGSRAELGTVATELTAFQVSVRSERGVDLSGSPFDTHRDGIASPVRHDETQALGRAMRDAGVELFRYPSARDPGRGAGIGVFSPAAFGRARPRGLEGWRCTATRERVEFVRRDYFTPARFIFERDPFLLEGELPVPAL